MRDISELELKKTQFQEGLWEGLMSGAAAPEVPELTAYWSRDAAGIEVQCGAKGDGNWLVRLAVPHAALGDGLQSFRICAADGTVLHRFEVLAGDALEGDLRAELAALRAEVDLLSTSLRALSRRSDS